MENNILSLEEAVTRREEARKDGKKVVFTNGCFDIIHRGHIDYLSEARSLGDMLIVGLNTDASMKRIKSGGRPVVNEEDRAVLISSFRFVDIVCMFDEDTPAEIIKALRPDILVKGDEYEIENIVGHKQVLAEGGKVARIKMTPGHSTSSVIKKIKELPD